MVLKPSKHNFFEKKLMFYLDDNAELPLDDFLPVIHLPPLLPARLLFGFLLPPLGIAYVDELRHLALLGFYFQPMMIFC